MKLFEKGKARIGLDILDLPYFRGVHPEDLIKATLRKFANQGFSFVRVFNAHKDLMLFKDFDSDHWTQLEKRLSYLFCEETGDQMFIPILDMTAYARLSLQKLNYIQWLGISDKATQIMNKIFGNNWICSPGNELTKAPNSFIYNPKKAGLPGQMERLGAWINDYTKHLISFGVNPENIMVNTIEDSEYPKQGHPSTGDMAIGADNSKIGLGGIVGVTNVINAVHKMHTIRDIVIALIRMFKARKLWKYISTNDGNPASGIMSDGVDPSARQNGNFRNSGDKQNATLVTKLCEYAKKGVGKILGSFGSYKIALWITDLFRDHYSHNIRYGCLDCGKINNVYLLISQPRLKKCKFCGGQVKFVKAEVITDWNYINFDRSEMMAQAFIKVFGIKGLPNRGKFPPVKIEIEDPEIEIIPDGEPEDEEITTEVIMKLTLKDKIKKWFNQNKNRFWFWAFVLFCIAGIFQSIQWIIAILKIIL